MTETTTVTPKSPDLGASPLLGIQSGNTVRMLRVCYTAEPTPQPTLLDRVQAYAKRLLPNQRPPVVVLQGVAGPRLNIQIVKVNPQVGVLSLGDAEAQMIDLIMTTPEVSRTVFDPERVTAINDHADPADAYAALGILINRASNLIAMRTRRGAGNTVLMHPDDIACLELAATSVFATTYPGDGPAFGGTETAGQWTLCGTLNRHLKVYSGPVPRGVAIVLYKGESTIENVCDLDAPAVYSVTDRGEKYLTVATSTPTTLANFADYFQIIELRTP